MKISYQKYAKYLASKMAALVFLDFGSTTKKKLLHTLEGHNRVIYALALSSDGETLYSGSYDHTIKIWKSP